MAVDLSSKVLVVEDYASVRATVALTLREIGFKEILEADGGRTAWDILNENASQIGLIVSDLKMDNGTGLDLLKRVRSDSRFTKLPFLMMTMESDKNNVLEAVEAGVSNFIVKPFTKETLKKKIESLLK